MIFDFQVPFFSWELVLKVGPAQLELEVIF